MMRIHSVHLVICCAVFLILLNVLALNLFSSGSYDCTNQCHMTYEAHIKTIKRLKQELRTIQEQKSQTDPFPNNHTIHMITPTYARWTQKADLTRLAQTLMHIKNLHWMLVEDSDNKTNLVKRFLKHSPIKSTHLNIRTKKELQRIGLEPVWRKNRGVEQRNIALHWLRNHKTMSDENDVVYFGDDDNTYDIKLFDEIRATQKLSVWPVGICGGLRWEGPICDETGRLESWHTSWAKTRPFPIDFAGFAIKLDTLLQHDSVNIDPNAQTGWLESKFLSQMVSPEDVECRANNCMKVLVWHTRTEKPKTKDEDKLIAKGRPSNTAIET